MSAIQVLGKDGGYLPYDESQIREMLKRGQISADTLFWKEGMPEWRPLKELPEAATTAAPLSNLRSQPINAPIYHFAKKTEPLTTVVKVMLGIYLFAAILNLFIGIVIMFHTFTRDFESVELDAHWMKYFADFSLVIFLLTAIPFLKWIYRANLNCRGFATDLKFTPGMASGSYFIPFANLVYPCQAMQEIWKVSRNPTNWQMEKASVLVGFWWTFWLLTSVLGQVLAHSPKTKAGDSLPTIIYTLQYISSTLIALEISKIILCILAFTMIHLITNRQKALTRSSL